MLIHLNYHCRKDKVTKESCREFSCNFCRTMILYKGEHMNFIWGIVKAGIYIVFRPKVVWKNPDMKRQLKNKPCIFIANHTSHKDGLFAGAVLNRYKPYSLVAKDWYDKKGMGFFLKRSRTIPIDRYNPDADWYIMGQDIIGRGSPMLVFPEGSTSKDGRMKEFKPGAALLASKMSVPVIPCGIVGEYKKFFGQRQVFIVGEALEMNCPENVRCSKYAREQIKTAQQRVYELVNDYKDYKV